MGIIGRTLALILRAFEFALLVRAVMSWIMPGDANRFTEFVYGITEPVIAPVRRLLFRVDFCRRCPVDLSFLVVLMLVEILRGFVRLI